jgi:hypothetical protein
LAGFLFFARLFYLILYGYSDEGRAKRATVATGSIRPYRTQPQADMIKAGERAERGCGEAEHGVVLAANPIHPTPVFPMAWRAQL